MKAMAVAVSKLVQGLSEQMLRSLPIRTVMPADAQAAANVSVYVICGRKLDITLTDQHDSVMECQDTL